MDIIPLQYNQKRNKHYIRLDVSGSSDAINLGYNYDVFTVMLSSVSGSVTLEFTLDIENNVTSNTALWHPTVLENITEDKGTAIDSPVNFVRVVGTGTCVLEVLS